MNRIRHGSIMAHVGDIARQFMGSVLLAILNITAGGGPALAQQSSLPVVKIGYPVWVGYGPLFLAQEKGFFEQEGVSVVMVRMDDPRLRFGAVAAGRLDAATTGLPMLPIAHTAETSLKCILPLDDSAGADGIVSKKSIQRISDLRGRTVAYVPLHLTEYYLSHVLAQAGMKLGDIKGMNLMPDDAASAFFAGRVDAAVTWEPWLTKAKSADGGHVLHDTRAAPGALSDCLAVPAAHLSQRRAQFQAVVRGWYKAVEYFKSFPEESIKIMAKKVGGWLEKPEEFSAALAGAKIFDREQAIRYFHGPESHGKKVMRDALAHWIAQGKADRNLSVDDLIDDSFVR